MDLLCLCTCTAQNLYSIYHKNKNAKMFENYKVNYTHSRTIVCHNFCEGMKLQLWLFYSSTYGFLSQNFRLKWLEGALQLKISVTSQRPLLVSVKTSHTGTWNTNPLKYWWEKHTLAPLQCLQCLLNWQEQVEACFNCRCKLILN